MRLDGARNFSFAKFARGAAITGVEAVGKQVAGQLHRDGGESLHDATRAHVGDCGAHRAVKVDAAVRVEALVLHHEERVLDIGRDFVEARECAALLPDFGDKPAVRGIESRRLTRLILIEAGE